MIFNISNFSSFIFNFSSYLILFSSISKSFNLLASATFFSLNFCFSIDKISGDYDLLSFTIFSFLEIFV